MKSLIICKYIVALHAKFQYGMGPFMYSICLCCVYTYVYYFIRSARNVYMYAKTNQKLQACHIKNNVICNILSQSTVIKINIKLH